MDHDLISGAFDTLVRVLHSAPPRGQRDLGWLADIASKSCVFNDYDRFPRFLSNVQSVHRLLALMWDLSGSGVAKGELRKRILDDARYFVYNLSKYSAKSNWGPFCLFSLKVDMPTFTPNWEHVRHCVNILLLHERDVEFPPYGLRNAIGYSAPDSHSRASDDWAGVEGVWIRDIYFLDYSTLFGTSTTRKFFCPDVSPLDLNVRG